MGLQEKMKKAEAYCADWCLNVNIGKTKIMKRGSKQRLLNTPRIVHISIISCNICQIHISKDIECKQNIDGNQEQQGPYFCNEMIKMDT